jgi:hypothetical protein
MRVARRYLKHISRLTGLNIAGSYVKMFGKKASAILQVSSMQCAVCWCELGLELPRMHFVTCPPFRRSTCDVLYACFESFTRGHRIRQAEDPVCHEYTSVSRVAQSVQCLVTGWTTGRSRFDPRQGQRIFPLACVSRPALGPTQPTVQWVPGVLSPGLKRGRSMTLTTHPHIVPQSRMSMSYTSSPPSAFMACSGTAFLYNILLEGVHLDTETGIRKSLNTNLSTHSVLGAEFCIRTGCKGPLLFNRCWKIVENVSSYDSIQTILPPPPARLVSD